MYILQAQVEYLGHEISGDGVRPGRRKTEAVSSFPIPKDVHGVRQFLGLASYFRKFVKGFASVAQPLTELLKKANTWRWEEKEHEAFNKLKESLINRPVLALYNSKAETELHTDASKWGLGGILMQRDKEADGAWRPVEYFSRTTTVL